MYAYTVNAQMHSIGSVDMRQRMEPPLYRGAGGFLRTKKNRLMAGFF
jgi:hypothetical protein